MILVEFAVLQLVGAIVLVVEVEEEGDEVLPFLHAVGENPLIEHLQDVEDISKIMVFIDDYLFEIDKDFAHGGVYQLELL